MQVGCILPERMAAERWGVSVRPLPLPDTEEQAERIGKLNHMTSSQRRFCRRKVSLVWGLGIFGGEVDASGTFAQINRFYADPAPGLCLEPLNRAIG